MLDVIQWKYVVFKWIKFDGIVLGAGLSAGY